MAARSPVSRPGRPVHAPRRIYVHLYSILNILAVLIMAGCGAGDGRVEVKGRVAIDGEPLADGAISFRPIGETRGPSSGGPVREGSFQVPAEKGLIPGTYQVAVIASRKTGRTINDPQMGVISELVQIRFREPPADATVRAGEANEFSFELFSLPDPIRRRP